MKKLLPFVLFSTLLSNLLLAQKLPILKASSSSALIVEGTDDGQLAWRLDPAARPDVYVISKSPKPKTVSFYTDTDSLKMSLLPGQIVDFVVLLNGKDSCFTRIVSKPPVTKFQRQARATHDTIPFVLTEYNNLKIKAVLNQTDTLFLKFDSGATGLLLTRDAIVQKTSLLAGQAGAKEGAAKPNFNRMSPYNTLTLGALSWDSLSVHPVALSGQGTDGRFGWDLFDGRVVEIDYDKSLFIVHSALPKVAKGYTRLALEYAQSLFCIDGTLEVRGKKYKNRFLFDNGYQRTIMLDTTLLARQHFPTDLPVIKTTVLQNGQGKEFPVVTVNNERLRLGKVTLYNIPAQKMTTSNPAQFPVHILGNEVLKRFNTILDFQKNVVYLKPNALFKVPYTDAS